jgi:PTS system ascorbate-specific IIC component
MIALFFHSAAAGVFGNATGGIRGAILGGVITGLIISLGQAVFVKYITPTTVADFILWGGDTDMFIFGTILKWILGIFS